MKSRTTAVAIAALAALAGAGCAGVSKLDYSHLGSRSAWQRPEDVVRALEIAPGDRVVDLGAGGGYFLPELAAAVGAGGVVYAVDVDAARMLELTEKVEREGLANVEIVLGDYDDPRVPDGSIDLVLMVNAYHHLEQRPAYLEGLRTDLAPGGRVAVIEPNAELGGVLGLFLDEGHTSSRAGLRGEMARAGYAPAASFDFLPVQIFEVFSPEAAAATAAAGR